MAVATAIGIGLAAVARSAQQDAEEEVLSRSTQQAVAEMEAEARATQQSVAEAASIRADDEARNAFSRELAASSLVARDQDPQLGLLLALQSVEETYRTDGSVLLEAEEALHLAVQAAADRMVLSSPGSDLLLWNIAFNPSGTRLVTYGTSGVSPLWQTAGFTRVWDAATGELQFTFPGFVVSEEWQVDDQLATVTDFEGRSLSLTFWSTSTGEASSGFKLEFPLEGTEGGENFALSVDDIDSAALSPDWRFLSITLSPGGAVWHVVWDLSSLEVIYSKYTPRSTTVSFEITSVEFSPHAGYLIAGVKGGQLRLLDFHEAEILETSPVGEAAVRDMDFSPDGKLIAIVSTCEAYSVLQSGQEPFCQSQERAIGRHILDAESMQESFVLNVKSGALPSAQTAR
jgi:hypothetical protein